MGIEAHSDATVVVTRPPPQLQAWVDGFEGAGVRAIGFPLLKIEELPAEIRCAHWHDLSPDTLDWVFVSSPAAAAALMGALPDMADRWPQLRWATPGLGTAQCLQKMGCPAHRITHPAPDAPQMDTEHLWPQWQPLLKSGHRVALAQGPTTRPWLGERLREAGARTCPLVLYDRQPRSLGPDECLTLSAMLHKNHIWLFSSSESVTALQCGLQSLGRVPPQTWTALCTHPRIAETARMAGWSSVNTLKPDMHSILQHLKALPDRDRVPTP